MVNQVKAAEAGKGPALLASAESSVGRPQGGAVRGASPVAECRAAGVLCEERDPSGGLRLAGVWGGECPVALPPLLTWHADVVSCAPVAAAGGASGGPAGKGVQQVSCAGLTAVGGGTQHG